MAFCALWVRTTRAINTHHTDLDDFEVACAAELGGELGGPLMGDDVLVYPIRYEEGPESLLRLLEPALRAARFEDWCAVDLVHDEQHVAAVVEREDDDEQNRLSLSGHPFHESLRHWEARGQPVNSYGAKVIFVDLLKELHDAADVVARIERSLPKPIAHFWQGRSSIAFGFRDPGTVAVSQAVLGAFTDEAVDCIGVFSIGSRHDSRTRMNPIGAFIEANIRLSRGLPAIRQPGRAPARAFRGR